MSANTNTARQGLDEVDAFVANLMEEKPLPQPLVKIRRGRDGDYNSAHQVSSAGWWICETGSDAEHRKFGEQSLCIWGPNYKIASDPDSPESSIGAMHVLQACAKNKGVSSVEIYWVRSCGKWAVEAYFNQALVRVEEETLSLAIAKFAKVTFSK